MPLEFSPQAPPEGAALVGRALAELGPGFFRTECGKQPRQLGVVPSPIRMYALRYRDPESLASSALPEADDNPVAGPWCYFVVDAAGDDDAPTLTPVGIVQLNRDDERRPGYRGANWVVGRVSAGDGYRHWGERLTQLARAVPHAAFEPRLFKVPALGVSALWVHRGNGLMDRFAPLTFGEAARAPVEPADAPRAPSGRVLSGALDASDFLDELRALARTRQFEDEATLPENAIGLKEMPDYPEKESDERDRHGKDAPKKDRLSDGERFAERG